MSLSYEAKNALIAYSDLVEVAQQTHGSCAHITGYASKSAEQACRIAGVLTLWEDLKATHISDIHMTNGILLAKFYLSEASRLSHGAYIPRAVQEADTLRKWLIDYKPKCGNFIDKDRLIMGDVTQSGPSFARVTDKARELLQTLAQKGHLIALPSGTIVHGKARKESWQIIRENKEGGTL